MDKAKTKQDEPGSPFPIVGIGASAGGLKAAAALLENAPADTGMAWVLVFHLDPKHKSEAAALLQRYTRMPVRQVTRRTPIEANHVYVVPPNHGLGVIDGALALTPLERSDGRPTVIDRFFRSLAKHVGEHAIGVVLSGMGSEGSLGLKAIKEAGGLTVVQEEAEAEFSGMPHNAIATGLIDFVLPAAAIPAKLLESRDFAVDFALPENRANGESDADILQKIFVQLRTRVGHDFTQYKQNTILRRVGRRMQVHQLHELSAYLDLLRSTPAETETLFRELLISVTNFFRDPEAMQALEHEVVPQLCKRMEGQTVRVWVPGCATGEEAYSLAMLLAEVCDAMASPPRLQIFASDVDDRALAVARRGFYSEAVATELSDARLKRFFDRDGEGYSVKGVLREMILFTRHDVLQDPPFSKVDLISCRNLLIYLKSEIQSKIFSLFHFALKPHGFLFLGSSESLGGSAKLFNEIDRKAKLFQARRMPISDVPFPVLPSPPRIGTGRREPGPPPRKRFEEIARAELLDRYAPPCVIVGENYDVTYVAGRVGRYLEPGVGEANLNVLDMAREGLRLELRTALYRAFHDSQGVTRKLVRMHVDGREELVALSVRPLAEAEGHVLVVFEVPEGEPSAPEPPRSDDADERIVAQLESELVNTRESLQTSIEELETSNEELRASNEELQSVNEELQSTTEELETGKEELQSTNEELLAVNQELQARNDELARTNSDLGNLITSTEIATLFLDAELRVRRFSPRATDVFNLIAGDIGRPFAHITHRLEDGSLVADAERVLHDLGMVEREFASSDGHFYQARIRPYRTIDNKVDGVVLTFVDISTIRQAEAARRESDARLALAVEIGNIGHWTLCLEGHELITSPACREHFGRAPTDAFSYQQWQDSIHPDDRAQQAQAINTAVERRAAFQSEYRIVMPAGGVRHIEVRGRFEANAGHGRVSGVTLDVTAQKELEAELRDNRRKLADELASVEALQDVSVQLITREHAADFYPRLLDAAMLLMHADFASLQVLDASGTQLRLLAEKNFAPESARHWTQVENDSGSSCGRALKAGERTVVADVDAGDFMGGARELAEYHRSGMRAMQSTPLLSRDGRVLGMLSTHWRNVHPLADDDFRLFDSLARQVADLLERTRVEDLVRTSEERFRALVTATSEVVFRVNANWSEMRNLRGGGFLADTADSNSAWIDTYIPHDEQSRVRAAIDAAVATGEVYELEHQVIRADGSMGWVASRAAPILDAQGHVQEWFGAAVDISGRKLREANLAFLAELSGELAQTLDPVAALDGLGARIGEHFRVAACAFGMVDETRHEITIAHDWTRPGGPSWKGTYDLGDADAQQFVGAGRAGKVYVVPDCANDTRHTGAREFAAALSIGALVSAPVVRGGVWRFQLTLGDRQPRAWDSDEIVLLREITERIWMRLERGRAEQALADSEVRYRTLFGSIDEAFCIVELLREASGTPVDYRYIEVNPAFARHTGLVGAAGRKISELLPKAEPERDWLDTYAAIVDTGQPRRFRMLWAGLQRIFDVYAFRLGGRGSPRLAVLFSDVTRRAEEERALNQFASIVQSSDDAIISKDLQGVVTSWNPSAERMFGYTAEEAVGRNVIDLIIPEDRGEEEDDILRRIAHGEIIEHFETVRRRKNGSALDVSVTISPLLAGGHSIGASKIARDISDRKRAEQHRELLINELNHRVKNTLATVQSLALQTFRGANQKAALDTFDARLLALSAAHDVLTHENWKGAGIRTIVRNAMAAWMGDEPRVRIAGPSLRLRPEAALALALALHELATNASKYGALSNENGSVSIKWSVSHDTLHCFRMHWQEHDGPPVSPPQTRGFGLSLIEDGLAQDLGGKVSLSFEKAGVACDIEAPLSEIHEQDDAR